MRKVCAEEIERTKRKEWKALCGKTPGKHAERGLQNSSGQSKGEAVPIYPGRRDEIRNRDGSVRSSTAR